MTNYILIGTAWLIVNLLIIRFIYKLKLDTLKKYKQALSGFLFFFIMGIVLLTIALITF